jgi:hypothetical protein
MDLDAMSAPFVFDLDKKAQFDELDVDPDVIYVKDGKLGEVKRRKDGTELSLAETALYSRWKTYRGGITGVKPFVRNGRGRAM